MSLLYEPPEPHECDLPSVFTRLGGIRQIQPGAIARCDECGAYCRLPHGSYWWRPISRRRAERLLRKRGAL